MGGFCRVHSIKVPSKMSADDPAGALPLVCYSLPLADMSGEYTGRAEGTSQVGLSHDPWAVTLMRARGHLRAPRATALLFSAQNKCRCGRVCCSIVSNTSHQYLEFAVVRLKISGDEGHGGRSSSPGGLQHWLPRGWIDSDWVRIVTEQERIVTEQARIVTEQARIIREHWDCPRTVGLVLPEHRQRVY